MKPETTTTTKCAHPACNCTVTGKDKFCSPHCHDTHRMLELACQCHHEGCGGDQLRH